MKINGWRIVYGISIALAASSLGIVFEKLFANEWPWWVLLTIAIPIFLGISMVASRYSGKRKQQRVPDIHPDEQDFRLKRMQALLGFMERNAIWIYVTLAMILLYLKGYIELLVGD